MEKQTALFKTNVSFIDKLVILIEIPFGLFGLLKIVPNMDLGGKIFFSSIFLLLIIQAIRSAKTFHLYEDELIIRRPYFFTNKSDVIFKVDEIKEIIFRNIKGRFGGPVIIIFSVSRNSTFRCDLNKEKLNEFILQLTKLSILTNNENS